MPVEPSPDTLPDVGRTAEQQANGAVDVILRDGGTLRLRPPVAADADAVLAFFEGLSERSLYLRFHGFRNVDRALAESLLDPDWVERGALSALAAASARRAIGELRAPARTRRSPRPPSPSPTMLQGRGHRHAAARAARRARGRDGDRRASSPRCCPRTARCSRLRGRRLRRRARASSGGDGRGRASRSRRPRATRRGSTSATTSPSSPRCARSSSPRSVAVVGASRRPRLDRRRALPQHPRGRLRRRRLPGQPRRRSPSPACAATRSIAEIPDPVDLAVICLPGEQRARGGRGGARTRACARSA